MKSQKRLPVYQQAPEPSNRVLPSWAGGQAPVVAQSTEAQGSAFDPNASQWAEQSRHYEQMNQAAFQIRDEHPDCRILKVDHEGDHIKVRIMTPEFVVKRLSVLVSEL